MTSHKHPDPESLDEASMNLRDYWNSPRVYEFDAEILEIDSDWLRLSRTFFYPEGGGQPADRGILTTKNETSAVIDVQEKDSEIWLHVKNPVFEEGFKVKGVIDQLRRDTLSRNHSAQHLLSAAFWEELEYDTTRALIGLKETELEFDRNPSIDDIRTAISAAEDQISLEIPIISRFYSENGIKQVNLRGKAAGSYQVYRIVEIGDYDRNACGGTHIENTGQIKNLLVSKIDGKRIKFITGQEANREASMRSLDLIEMSRSLGSPIDHLVEDTQKLIQQKEQLEKLNLKQQQKITELAFLSATWMTLDDYQLKFVQLEVVDRGQILSNTSDLQSNEVVIAYNDQGTFILTAKNELLVEEIASHFQKSGVKGGGKGNVIMGKFSSSLPKAKLIQLIHDGISGL